MSATDPGWTDVAAAGVYLLAVPRDLDGQRGDASVVVVTPAAALCHPALAQSDGMAAHLCLTAVPRLPGMVLPLSTLSSEWAVPELWSQVADWDALAQALVGLGRRRACPAVTLVVPPFFAQELANAPLPRPDPLLLARVPRPSRYAMTESVARRLPPCLAQERPSAEDGVFAMSDADRARRLLHAAPPAGRERLPLRTRVARLVSRER